MERDILPLHTGFGLIRSACPADADQIIQMVGQLADHHGDVPTLDPNHLSRDLFSDNPRIHVLVAEAGGVLIGYAAMCRVVRLQFGRRGMDIHHLLINADFRGQGVGRDLIEACKLKATAMSCCYLTVGAHPDDHRAQAFYEALGFNRKDAHPPQVSFQLAS